MLNATKIERRDFDRFALEREVAYRVAGKTNLDQVGKGKTVNMSSKGILFTTQHFLPPGKQMSLLISWPPETAGGPTKLLAHGRVVSCKHGTASMEIYQFEFKA